MQAAVAGAFMVRLPPATNTQSLYADRCINMHKGQRPLFGRVECRERSAHAPGSSSVRGYLYDEVGVEGDADPFQ